MNSEQEPQKGLKLGPKLGGSSAATSQPALNGGPWGGLGASSVSEGVLSYKCWPSIVPQFWGPKMGGPPILEFQNWRSPNFGSSEKKVLAINWGKHRASRRDSVLSGRFCAILMKL